MKEQILTKIEENIPKTVRVIENWLTEDFSTSISDGSSKAKEYTGRQLTSLFFIAIGNDLGEQIFRYLDEMTIETIVFEISRTEYVSYEIEEKVLAKFEECFDLNKTITNGGVDYARKILEKSFGAPKAIDILNRLTSSLQVRPFDFIRRTDPTHLLNFIQQEHPQTIAAVLSYLEPNKSSVILQNLPCEVQSDVTRRIATMDLITPETLREVERVLEKQLSTVDPAYQVSGGVESTVEILNLVDRATEKQIIEALEDEDPELAEEIKRRMFIFEDIVMLDDRSIQKMMREVDSQELAKSLFNVDREVQEKIFRNMSKRAASMLKEDMEYMGPIRIKDVEESQQKIVSIIRHLEDTGEIVVARAGEDELVVCDSFPETRDEARDSISTEFETNIGYLSDKQIKDLFNIIYHEDIIVLIVNALAISPTHVKDRLLNRLNIFKNLYIRYLIWWRRKNMNYVDTIVRAQKELVRLCNDIRSRDQMAAEENDDEEDEGGDLCLKA